jgi:U6 snRNA-associated Sm-like protein LSm1
MIGDVDIDKEDEPIDKLERVPFMEAEKEQRATKKENLATHKQKSKSLHNFGMVTESFVEF